MRARRLAAGQGYAPAQYNLGGMFSRGLSAAMTRDEALQWLGQAAAQGHSAAEKELAALEAAPVERARASKAAASASEGDATTL